MTSSPAGESRFVLGGERSVYSLGGLPREALATLVASWARSPRRLREELADLLERPGFLPTEGDLEAARRLHEGAFERYGHASAAEHAVVHLVAEDASLVASRAVEQSRLISITEKSGRYRTSGPASLLVPPELASGPAGQRYRELGGRLLQLQASLMGPVAAAVDRSLPAAQRGKELARQEDVQSRARAVLRHLTPLGAKTAFVLTINGRSLAHLLSRLAESELGELVRLGSALRDAALPTLPTLVRWIEPSSYRLETAAALSRWTRDLLHEPPPPPPSARSSASLVRSPENAEELLVAAILYRFSDLPWPMVRRRVQELDQDTRAGVMDEFLRRRGKFDAPLRELEHAQYTFDVLIDGSAMREIHRHRMATQTPQELTTAHGFVLAEELTEAGVADEVRHILDESGELFEELRSSLGPVAAYILPLAFRQRTLISMNLRSLHHFVALRSARQGHAEVRQIAQGIYKQLERSSPLVARYVRVTTD